MRKQILLLIVMLACVAIFGACFDDVSTSECKHSGGTATCQAKAICEKCGEEYGELASHAYGAWKHDETKHWKECTTEGCTAKTEEGNHEGGTKTCIAKAVCEKCGEEYGELADHAYGEWKYDAEKHWKECTTAGCDSKSEEAVHAFTKSGSDSDKHWKECECGAKSEEAAHNYTENKFDTEKHWKECSCGAKSEETAHVLSYDKDDTQHWQKCDCGYETAKADHVLAGDHNETQHWQKCDCGYETAKADHVLAGDHNETQHWQKCDCGYETVKAGHVLVDEYNDTQHWQKCDCGYETVKAGHVLVDEYNDTQHWQKCDCGYETAKVNHVLAGEHNETQHWQKCDCGYETAKADHVLAGDHNETQHWQKCDCGYETAKADHVLTDDHNETQHWQKCECGYETVKENHMYSLIEGEVYDEYSCGCGFKNDGMKFKKTVDNVDKDLVLSVATCAIDLTGISDATVESIKLIAGNEEIDLGNDAKALNVETLKTKTQNHGKQTITVVVKSGDGFSHTVLVPVIIVTKEIKTMTELQDSVKWLGGDMDNIYGYFTLGCNITVEKDFVAKNGGISYSSGKAFRGTLDGRGFSITFNSSAAGCGLFGTMNGATIKNVTITDSWNNNGNRPMLAYNAYNVTFEKVKLVLGSGSPKNGNEGHTPLIGASVHGCTFKNVEILSNVSIVNVFYDAKNNKFESLKITADITGKFSKDIELTDLPENVTIEPKTAA